MHRILLLLLAGLLLASAGSARASPVVVVEHWPPWEIANEDTGQVNGGIAVELVRELFLRLGLEPDFRVVPWQRAVDQVRQGRADVIPMITRNSDRAEDMKFTRPVYVDRLWLVSASTDGDCDWTSPGALKGQTVGLTRDYTYGPVWAEIQQEHDFSTRLANRDETHLKQAISGRVDFSLQYESFLRSHLNIPEVDRTGLTLCRPAVQTIPLRLGISRASPLSRRVDEFNQVLDKMKADGSYREILGDLHHDAHWQ